LPIFCRSRCAEHCGRFKAGKSSFLNHVIGRDVLPVGVIPVTSVVTEVEYSPEERAEIRFTDGHTEFAPVNRVKEFVTEAENPENVKRVSRVRLELPLMQPYRGLRFVDTPGLESAHEHNTATALEWLPNVGLALIAVAADLPLSQSDIEFIRNVSRYTPRISLLLTKIDVLDLEERAQVTEFVQQQLARHASEPVQLFPFSVRPGFDEYRSQLNKNLLSRVQQGASEQHEAILRHKLQSLIQECSGYLNIALKSSEAMEAERGELWLTILGKKETAYDARLSIRLIVRHTAQTIRPTFEALLQKDEAPTRQKLLAELENQFPSWAESLRVVTERFDGWLCKSLTEEMTELSRKHHSEFVAPLRDVSRQLSQSLQDFRNRLSERILKTLGVELRLAEIDLGVDSPRSPDIRVGKIFDRNWELLSFIVPMSLVKGTVKKHFERKAGDLVFTNLSRLASQWEDLINARLCSLEEESIRRLNDLMTTIERLVASAGEEAPRIRADIEELDQRLRALN
jgi:GTP-binding protein EngB required for normal cell division